MFEELKIERLKEQEFQNKRKGTLYNLLNAQDEVDELQSFYNKNCLDPYEKPISRTEAKILLGEYEREFNPDESDNSSDGLASNILTAVLVFIITVITYAIRLTKRYIIYLNNNHKIAKTIDKIYKDPNLAENDIECQKYKKLLDNPETCPKNIWDAANTNKWMSVAGVFMLIHSAFMALYYINYLINDHNFLSIHFTEIYSNLSDGVYYVFRSGSESLRNFAQYAIWLDTHINTFNKDLLRNAQVLNPLCHIVVYTVSIYAAIAYLKRNKMIGAKLHLFSILLDSVFTIILTGSNSTLIMYLFRDNAYFIILKILIQVILCSYICKDQKDRIPDIATCIYACVYLLPIISSVAGVIYRNDSIIFLVLDIITSLAAFLSYIFIIMGRRVYHNKTESK